MINCQNKTDFEGRTVLITGASRGIAAEIAMSLAKEKANIILNYCAEADKRIGQENSANELAQKIINSGGKATLIEQDLMKENAGVLLMEKVYERVGDVDSVILSASLQYNIPFLEQSLINIEEQIQINLISNIQILQSIIPKFKENDFGRILTIGSIQEVSPSPKMPIYALTKAALKNLVENLSIQLAPHGITVNNLSPGLIETDRNEHRRTDSSEWSMLSQNANPMRRVGLPSDLTGAAVFLLSKKSSFITGTTIYATGGAHIPQPLSDGNF